MPICGSSTAQYASPWKEQRAKLAGLAHGAHAPPSAAAPSIHDETIQTTTNHPWLTADHGWILASFLRVGEPVQRVDGSTALVVAVRAEPGAAAMWDLTVSTVHTFAVGGGAYVVHNCGDGEGRKFWRKGNGGEPPKGSDLITEDRPGRSADIKPDGNDDVHPAANGKKGYSVFDKPGAFGNADEWYYATENDLPDGIKLTWNENPNPRGFTHGTLGPSGSMPRGRFEDLFDQIPWRQ